VARILLHESAKSELGNPRADGTVAVQGYPAVRSTAPGADPARECLLYVDVADGQSLVVEYLRGLDAASDRGAACLGAQQSAGFMVQALMTSPR
jgi:hypothetical protein